METVRAVVVAGLSAFLFRKLAPPYWNITESSLMPVTIALAVLLPLLVFRLSKSDRLEATGGEEPGDIAPWQLGVISFAVFLLIARWNFDLFPANLHGESENTIRKAQTIVSAVQRGWFFSIFREYNLGLGPFFVPFLWVAETSMTWNKMATLLTVGGLLGLFAFLFSSRYRNIRWHILLLAPLASAVLLTSVRRYKWHVMILLAALAVYALVLLLERERVRKRVYAAVGLLFGVALFTYHGNIFFVAAFSLVLLVDLAVRRKWPSRYRYAMLASLLIGGVAVAIAVMNPRFSFFTMRFLHESAGVASRVDRLAAWNNALEVWLTRFVSWPLATLFFLGLASAISRFRDDSFARVSVILFGFFFTMLLVSGGFQNYDENHFVLLPFVALCFEGCRRVGEALSLIPTRTHALLAAFALTIGITWAEASHYYGAKLFVHNDFWPGEGSRGAEATAYLLEAKARLHDPTVRLFLPGKALAPNLGGFSDSDAYKWDEFQEILKRTTLYSSFSEVSAEVTRAGANDTHSTIVLYYGPEAESSPELAAFEKDLQKRGFSVAREKSQPFGEYYANSMMVRFLRIAPLG